MQQELITQSNFTYKEHYVTALDGYITLLLELINPEATELRYPPVFMHHGASIDPTCYLMASSKQHFPEKYPRTAADGPIRSSNRSLAFTLANNGYQVILIGTRGCNKDNQGHTKDALGINNVPPGQNNSELNLTSGEIAYEYARTPFYWQYGQDDVKNFELRKQWDTALNFTNATEFILLSYSLSTTTTMAYLAENPDYAAKVRLYVQLAPPIAAVHENDLFDKVYFEDICPLYPTRGIGFTPTFVETPIARQAFIQLSANPTVKYTVLYEILSLLFGPSPLYATNIERNSVSKILMDVSFKTIQQYCQNSVAQAFRKFDYGPAQNLLIYGTAEPPTYDYSYLNVQNHVIVSGDSDGLASPLTVDKFAASVRSQRELIRIYANNSNHYDLVSGTCNNNTVNLPLIGVFNRVSNATKPTS